MRFMKASKASNKERRNIRPFLAALGVALAFGLLYWIADAIFNFYLFRTNLRFLIFEPPQTLFDSIIMRLSPHTRFTRLSFLAASMLGGLLLGLFLQREQIAKEALRFSEERLHLAMEATSDGLWDWDLPTGSVYFSPRWQEMLGFELGEMDPTHAAWNALVHPDDFARVQAGYAAVLKGEQKHGEVEYRIRTRTGDWIWVLDRGKVVERNQNGRPVRMIGTATEITASKEAQAELDRHREHLEELVAERTEQLEKVNQELRDFAYVVSHDLKAPLRAVTQLAGWIAEDYTDALDDNGREMLDLLVQRTARMNALIEGILHFSRIGRVTDEERPVDLDQLVHGVVEMLAPPAGISVQIAEGLPTVTGDETRFMQVFSNLVGNAIKFMDKPEGYVQVGTRHEDTHWLIWVADDGPGINPRYHAKVFQLFQTLVARDQVESTGIGLALVKKIVEGWGGRIWLESDVGAGSTFFFTIPERG